jgi:nicotinamide mononucleotide transporter
MDFFHTDFIFFTAWGYPVSYIEFAGLITGLVAVALSARAHVLSWPIGIVNVVLSFFLYYQVQLYPDMFLRTFSDGGDGLILCPAKRIAKRNCG